MTQEERVEERLTRIKKAVGLQRPDRVPVVLEYCTFAARVTNTPLPEFLLNLKKSVETMIQAYDLVAEKGEIDAINYGQFSPYGLSYLWLSKVSVSGVDLPDDVSFQVIEKERLVEEDYDRILKTGWPVFFKDFVRKKILKNVPPEYLPFNQPPCDAINEWGKHGMPVLTGGTVVPPFELLCGGRSLNAFFMDLFDIPDKVQAVMDEMMPHLSEHACRRARQEGYPCVWVGGWRGAPAMISPDMWNRFYWPYFKKLVHEVVEKGLIPILHLDACWDRELSRFKELPKGKVLMALDGYTDIFKAKEILDGHMCIMGDVPATMLSFEDPDTVYSYSSRLIRELGPEGFILQSGCDIPENAKLENVQAMVAAANAA